MQIIKVHTAIQAAEEVNDLLLEYAVEVLESCCSLLELAIKLEGRQLEVRGRRNSDVFQNK